MPGQAVELCELGVDARRAQQGGERCLFGEGEQRIAPHSDDERRAQRGTAQHLHRIAMRGEVEPVHRTRELQVAVRIEAVCEARALLREMVLHREVASLA